MKRDFLEIPDFSAEEIDNLLGLAERMRTGEYTAKPLTGKSLAMIFTKASTRTRVSFEAGTWQLGGHAMFLSARDVQLGRGEPIADTARVLSGYVDGIMIRTYAHNDVVELARYATVPVINGLTDLVHPCQVLADLLTIRQAFGDYRNRRVACPEGYEPDAKILARAKTRAKVTVMRDPAEAADGADVVNTDVWASMGQEEEQTLREKAFAGFTVDAKVMSRAKKESIFLHCLPAHRGEEVQAEVIDGKQSRVWDEAHNRLHVQKALMAVLMGGERI